MTECSFIDYRLHDHGVAVLTLDNPPLNLTTLATVDQLISTCRDIAGAAERVVVATCINHGWLSPLETARKQGRAEQEGDGKIRFHALSFKPRGEEPANGSARSAAR